MGDTGSLALGGAIAGLAIFAQTELLLPLLAGLFLIITLSVIGQVGSYKLTGQAHVPHGAAASSLRDARLAGDPDRRALLDHPGPVRRRRARRCSTPSGCARDRRMSTTADARGLGLVARARVTVAGIGVAGFAAADALVHLGARVTVVDAADGERQRERAEILDVIGVPVLLG